MLVAPFWAYCLVVAVLCFATAVWVTFPTHADLRQLRLHGQAEETMPVRAVSARVVGPGQLVRTSKTVPSFPLPSTL